MFDSVVDSNTVIITRAQPPAWSWWLGCEDDAEFVRRHRRELPRIQGQRIASGLETFLDSLGAHTR